MYLSPTAHRKSRRMPTNCKTESVKNYREISFQIASRMKTQNILRMGLCDLTSFYDLPFRTPFLRLMNRNHWQHAADKLKSFNDEFQNGQNLSNAISGIEAKRRQSSSIAWPSATAVVVRIVLQCQSFTVLAVMEWNARMRRPTMCVTKWAKGGKTGSRITCKCQGSDRLFTAATFQ